MWDVSLLLVQHHPKGGERRHTTTLALPSHADLTLGLRVSGLFDKAGTQYDIHAPLATQLFYNSPVQKSLKPAQRPTRKLSVRGFGLDRLRTATRR